MKGALFTVALTASASFSALAVEPFDTGIQEDIDDIRVFYNESDATAFVYSQHNTIYLNIPFPMIDVPFFLRIEDRAGEVQLEGRYQIVSGKVLLLDDMAIVVTGEKLSGNEIDDLTGDAADVREIEYATQVQIDLTGLAAADSGSGFSATETTSDGESDLLATLRGSWATPRLTAAAELEAVHRSNPDNTVRFGGPRADVARMSSSLQFNAPAGASFSLSAGDVSADSSSSLVSTGISSRGFIVGFATPNEKFSWTVARLFGHDIVGTVRGPLGLSNESYRISTNYRFNVINSEKLVWDISVSNLRAKRNTQDDFRIGAHNSGEENDVWGASSNFSIMDGRIALSFAFAHSDYDNPSELNEENLPVEEGIEAFDPGVTSGSAYSHSVTWEVMRTSGDSPSLSLEAATERADPFYRSVHGQFTADRRQWSLYSSFSKGAFSGRVGTTQYQNNLDNLISIHTLDEAVHQAEFSIQTDYFSDNEENDSQVIRNIIPSNISLYATIENLKTLNGDVIILAPVIEGFDFMDQTTETYGVSATWEKTFHSTTLDLGYSFFDNNQRERASADRRDINYGFSHSINRDKWNLTGRVSFNTSDDLDEASRSRNQVTEWGLSGSYSTDSAVTWTVAYDSDVTELNYFLSDDDQDTTSSSVSLSVDYGAWLRKKLALKFEPSMTLRFYRSTNESRSDFFSDDQVTESLSFNIGVSF